MKPFTMTAERERADRVQFEHCVAPCRHSALRRAWTEIEAMRIYIADLRKDEKTAFRRGVEAAAGVAADYDSASTHAYLVSDCILCKLNMTRRLRPRKNKRRVVVK